MASRQGQGKLETKQSSWDRDPTATGIEEDLVVWWLEKEVLSREGRACEVSLHDDDTLVTWRYRMDTCWDKIGRRPGADLRPRCPINTLTFSFDLTELTFS